MTYTFYGHSCFSIEVNGIHILFDPFITGNELASQVNVEEISADYILLSHGHSDHILDCVSIALRTGAKVVCSFEVHEWLNAKGVTNTHPMNLGGKWTFDEFTVKCVVAQHSSALPDGSYGGNPMGFLVFAGNESFYFAGDTALTMDMQLIPLWARLSFAILPLGDNFTMGIEDAVIAARYAGAKKIIGVHYDTFGYIKIHQEEAKRAFSDKGLELLLPEIGESISL